MDFFEAQRQAKRNTTRLMVLFGAAVVTLTLGLFTLVSLFLELSDAEVWSNGSVFALTTIATLAIIGGGAGYKISQLRDGGATVCRLMGAVPIALMPDQETRRLRNIVEEMALAAGIPVPQIFLLDEDSGINGFTAGFTPRDAAICVTRGCLDHLNRDELQGIIAHEFSHILNGDMRLNIRLMGVLHGILCISMTGYLLLRHGYLGGRRGGTVGLIGLGLAFVAFGSIGALFARIIKAAVSRQQAFLADAAAVQFTRNPTGIRDALRKIEASSRAGRVDSVQAHAASHMFFTNAMLGWMPNWFATHPPIEKRIAAIDASAVRERARVAVATPVSDDAVVPGLAGLTGATIPPAAALGLIGQVTPEHVDRSQRFLQALPMDIAGAVRDPFSARAVIYGLLLDADRDARRTQFRILQDHADPATVEETLVLSSSISNLERPSHLPLIDLAMPALRMMSLAQAEEFRMNVHRLIDADDRVSPFEFSVEKILARHVHAHYVDARPDPIRFHSIASLHDDCRRVLTILAHHGHEHGLAAQQAFDAGAAVLDLGTGAMPLDECMHADFDRSLDRLAQADPQVKHSVLMAFAQTVANDGVLTPTEVELLRAIADTLDCPMPPALPLSELAAAVN